MRTILRAAARLYPRAWRARYGEEFDVLIDHLTPRWRDVLNIILGALIMHISRLAALPVALAIGGVTLGAAVSMLMPPVYTSSARVLVQLTNGPVDESERVLSIRAATDAVLKQSAIDKKVIAATLDQQFKRDGGLGVTLLDVQGSAGSAPTAKQETEKALGAIMRTNLVASNGQAQNAGLRFTLLELPTLPVTSHRDSTRNGAIGGVLGLAVGGVVVLLARRRKAA